VGLVYLRTVDADAPTFQYIGAEKDLKDRWMTLGDLGWMDEDGYVYLSDRRTDLIISGGANVYPLEVEAAIAEHPDVRSCVVIGLPDDDMGQKVHAIVQAPGLKSENELREFLAERLAPYKIPRTFEFVDAPLRDEWGKARRFAFRTERQGSGSS
jgi:bile acid-coenzyme A ligase